MVWNIKFILICLLLIYDFYFDSFSIIKMFLSSASSEHDPDKLEQDADKYENIEVKFINTNKVYHKEINAYNELKEERIKRVNEEYEQQKKEIEN